MARRVEALSGLHRVEATTMLLQRARRVDPDGGVWDAADIQWWWRRPRPTDDLALPVWFDDDGPCGAVVLTDWGDNVQADALAVPGTVELDVVWSALLDAAEALDPPAIEVHVRDDDGALLELVGGAGFEATDDHSGLTWMHPSDRPPLAPPPPGFEIVDRATRAGGVHPMAARNGDEVEARLQQVSLYDASLDLAIYTVAGEPAGYALFWHDPTTGVGMLEPMRVEDAYQRRGLARALLTAGLNRLARRGATRLKVGFDGDAGRNLYLGAGFEEAATIRLFRR